MDVDDLDEVVHLEAETIIPLATDKLYIDYESPQERGKY